MQESNFYRRVLEQALLAHKSINQVERELGYPRNSLHNYKAGVEPSGTRLVEISNYFGVQPEYLMGFVNNHENILVHNLFNALDNNQKKELTLLCQEWLVSKVRE